MTKPKDVVNHWHYFPRDETENDMKRVDICEQKDGNFVVWILETNASLNFDNSTDALVFAKMFMLGRWIKPLVDMSNRFV